MDLLIYIKRFLKDILYFIYPPVCMLCSRSLEENEKLICFDCESDLDSMPFALCPFCEGIVLPDQNHCAAGHSEKLDIEFIRPFGTYTEGMRQLIHSLKYDRKLSVAEILGVKLSEMIKREFHFKGFDAYIPTPLHKTKKRSRGYNQSDVIANVLSRETNIPVLRKVLVRKRFTTTQTALNKEERAQNVKGAFEVDDKSLVAGRNFILVDDVYTTGATLREMARVLKEAGAGRIAAVTLAKPGLDKTKEQNININAKEN
ncbi:ComF family protein [bacterium]|nr:ComF family protein [bacterium]